MPSDTYTRPHLANRLPIPAVTRHLFLGLIVVLLQWLIFGRLEMWGAYPDAVLLFIGWMGLRHGRLVGSASGFGFGLLLDLIYGTWGIHMFVKTLVGFLVGLFPAEDRETLLITPQQAFLGALVIALFHNGLFVTFLALQSGARTTTMLTGLWLGAAFYTATVALITSLFAEG